MLPLLLLLSILGFSFAEYPYPLTANNFRLTWKQVEIPFTSFSAPDNNGIVPLIILCGKFNPEKVNADCAYSWEGPDGTYFGWESNYSNK